MAGTRGIDLVVTLGFGLLIGSVAVIEVVCDLRNNDRPKVAEIFMRAPSRANLRLYERNLVEKSWVEGQLRPWGQLAQLVLLQDAGSKALAGRNGWFFYKPGVEYLTQRRPPTEATHNASDALRAIVAYRDALAARGIKLLVVIVPNKESIYPEMLSQRGGKLEAIVAPETRSLLDGLSAAGVETVDLFRVFAAAKRDRAACSETGGPVTPLEPLYLAQDTHWSPAGAELAARTVAQRCVELGWISPGSTGYVCKQRSIRRLGDVLRMLQSPPLERHIQPEEIHCQQVVELNTGQIFQPKADCPVLVLGDSFLRIFEYDEPRAAGFLAHLARNLRQPVAALVSDGGASTLVRQDLYRRRELLQDKKLVIWEFVERDIRFGAEGWQLVPLPPVAHVGR